jgi:HsdM N-terminal domain
MISNGIVQKLWNYCNLLRDDGLSYGDYVEQLTFLLFLKMADEQTGPPSSGFTISAPTSTSRSKPIRSSVKTSTTL